MDPYVSLKLLPVPPSKKKGNGKKERMDAHIRIASSFDEMK